MLVSVLSVLVLASEGAAQNPDSVVTTARSDTVDLTAAAPVEPMALPSSTVSSASLAAGQALSTSQQIDNWLNQKPTGEQPAWRERENEPRRMQGEVSVGVGSHDYNHASANVQMPLGENGTLSLGFSRTQNGWYERPMGPEGYFWSPQDEFLGPQWITPSGRSYSPLDRGRSLIKRPQAEDRDN